MLRHKFNTRNQKPDHIPADIWDSYSDVFDDKPCCLPVTYRIKMNPDVDTVIRLP